MSLSVVNVYVGSALPKLMESVGIRQAIKKALHSMPSPLSFHFPILSFLSSLQQAFELLVLPRPFSTLPLLPSNLPLNNNTSTSYSWGITSSEFWGSGNTATSFLIPSPLSPPIPSYLPPTTTSFHSRESTNSECTQDSHSHWKTHIVTYTKLTLPAAAAHKAVRSEVNYQGSHQHAGKERSANQWPTRLGLSGLHGSFS